MCQGHLRLLHLLLLFALIQNELMNAGQTRLGFLNPLLYHLQKVEKSVFVDVNEGSNANAPPFGSINFNVPCKTTYGFNATDGWDAASGLGYLNYPKMLSTIKAMMPKVKNTCEENGGTTASPSTSKGSAWFPSMFLVATSSFLTAFVMF